MKKKSVVKVVRFVLKYFLPIVLGWLEGDTHAVADTFLSLVSAL